MGLFSTICPNCNERVSRLQSDCKCQWRLGGPFRLCQKEGCPGIVPDGSKFCGECRTVVGPTAKSAIRWRRRPEDVARHVYVNDVGALFEGGVIVSHGVRAMLFIDGRYEMQLQPGRHGPDIGEIQKYRGQRRPVAASVLLIDEADIEIDTGGCRVLFSDNSAGLLRLLVALRFADAVPLYENVMKDAEEFSRTDLLRVLMPSLREATRTWARGRRQQEVAESDRTLREDLCARIREQAQQSFLRYGLDLLEVRSIELSSNRQEIDDLQRDEEDTKARIEVLRRVRERLDDGRIWDEQSKEKVAAAIEEVDQKRILREDQKRRILANLEHGQKADQMQRDFVLRRTEIEHTLELDRLGLLGRKILEKDALDIDLAKEKARLDFDLTEANEWIKVRIAAEAAELRREREAQQIKQASKDQSEANKRKLAETLKGLTPEQIAALAPILDPDLAPYIQRMQQAPGTDSVRAEKDRLLDHILQTSMQLTTGLVEGQKRPVTVVAVPTAPAMTICPHCHHSLP